MSRLFKTNPFANCSSDIEVEPPARIRKPYSPRLRLWLAAGGVFCAFALLGGRMAVIALEPHAPAEARRVVVDQSKRRAQLLDRDGRLLATTLQTWEVFLRPRMAAKAGGVSPDSLEDLGKIFPRLDLVDLRRQLVSGKRTFTWIARKASPDQWRRARDLGIIGLEAKPREDRVYPPGRLVAHIVGGVDVDNIGVAGIEAGLNDRISADENGEAAPLELSVDLRVQSALRRTLSEAKSEFAAPGAAGLVMKVRTGEILAMVSLPDFDPNDRPAAPKTVLAQAASPLFNKPVQGLFELGSIFKLITTATALEMGAADLETPLDATFPLRRGGFTISDYKGKERWLTVREMVRYSSNIAAVRLADRIGPVAQERFFDALNLNGRVPLAELPVGERSIGQTPKRWGSTESATVSYGHGVSVSPLHLLTAIASLANDGCRVKPTLLKLDEAPGGCDRIVREDVSETIRDLMRLVAEKSSGRNANIPGYEVGGKTGTAYQVRPTGGYNTDKRFNSFLALWPTSDPQYIMIVSLDDPKLLDGSKLLPLAGRTAAPTAGRALERIAPLLGIVPKDRFPNLETADAASSPGDEG